MDLPTIKAPFSEVKNENENSNIEEGEKNQGNKKPNKKKKHTFHKGAKKRIQKFKNGIKNGVQNMVLKKVLKMGIDQLKKDFWIGVEVFKESAQIGMKKLKRASVISSQLAQKGFKNTKGNLKKLRLKANDMAKDMKLKMQSLKAKAQVQKSKAKELLKIFNHKTKHNAKKIGVKIIKIGRNAKTKYAKAVKKLQVLNNNMKEKRVDFCIWFMYNCHTMKLLCLECWMIENPQIIMNKIKECESSCAMLIPNGYGAIIHRSLILTPYQYINDSKIALKGEVLIQFGGYKSHSPAASCIASDVEIERGLNHLAPRQKQNNLSLPRNDPKLRSKSKSSTSSKQVSRVRSPTSSKPETRIGSKQVSRIGSPTSSKPGTRRGSPTSSSQCSRMGSRPASKSASRAGTPPSTPLKQHTHKLLPSRIYICNEALDLTLVACDPLPTSMVPLGLGKANNGREMDLYRRIYILGYKKQLDGTASSLSIGIGRIIDMDKLFLKFATVIDNWHPGSIGFDERGNFSFIVSNPQKIKPFVSKESNAHNSSSKNDTSTRNGYLLSHRSAFGMRVYEREDYAFGPKFALNETIEHIGVIVQSIRQWITTHWEGLSFDKLIPPLGWRSPAIGSLPSEYEFYTNPKVVKQKWCSDYDKPPSYAEIALFMNVYSRLAALRRECSKAKREHDHFKHLRLAAITSEQQCLDVEAHGANLINPGCSKFRKSHVVKKEPPRNLIRKSGGAIRRALAHKRGHQDPPKPKRKKKPKNHCKGCL